MKRASIANISAAQTVEDIKKILAEIIKVLNTSRATENTLSASASALSDGLDTLARRTSFVVVCESDNDLDPSANSGFNFSFGT